jgi:hypothetical protein
MEYQVRPTDKHPVVLPVGHEGEFKVKGALYLRMAEGQGDRKMRAYQVVSEKPLDGTKLGRIRGQIAQPACGKVSVTR